MKYLLYAIPLLLLLFTISLSISQVYPLTTSSSSTQGVVSYGSVVCVCKGDSCNIHTEGASCSSNIIVNNGLDLIEDALSGTGGTVAQFNHSFIGLCNASNGDIAGGGCSSPVAGTTFLQNEFNDSEGHGLNRSAGIYTSLGVGNWSLYNTFTSHGPAVILTNQTCLFNQSITLSGVTAGSVLACNNFTLVTLNGVNNDQITVNWTIFVTSG